jgi:hypothetical protein
VLESAGGQGRHGEEREGEPEEGEEKRMHGESVCFARWHRRVRWHRRDRTRSLKGAGADRCERRLVESGRPARIRLMDGRRGDGGTRLRLPRPRLGRSGGLRGRGGGLRGRAGRGRCRRGRGRRGSWFGRGSGIGARQSGRLLGKSVGRPKREYDCAGEREARTISPGRSGDHWPDIRTRAPRFQVRPLVGRAHPPVLSPPEPPVQIITKSLPGERLVSLPAGLRLLRPSPLN